MKYQVYLQNKTKAGYVMWLPAPTIYRDEIVARRVALSWHEQGIEAQVRESTDEADDRIVYSTLRQGNDERKPPFDTCEE